MDWNEPSAYPFKPLRLKPYDTADVIRTARSGRWFRGVEDPRRRALFEEQPDSWLADPTDLTVFSWENGVFAMNVLHATREELGGVEAEPKVGNRTQPRRSRDESIAARTTRSLFM